MTKKHKPDFEPSATLCDACVHAYGDDCFSVPQEQRPWIRRYESKLVSYHPLRPYEVRLIKECDRYERGRKPLPRFSPSFRGIMMAAYFAQAAEGLLKVREDH